MILKEVEIHNFRSIVSLRFSPKRLTTFVGKNSCGKSNIFRALRFFFKASAKSGVSEDVCKFSDGEGTWVECTFGALTASEKDEFQKYVLCNQTIRVRRTLFLDGEKCSTKLQGYLQSPEEEWLQDDYPDYGDMEKWTTLGIDVSAYAELGARGNLTKPGFRVFRDEYISRNAGKLQFSEVLSDTEFKGRQSTAASLLPHFIFVPAVGDIASVIYGKQGSLLNEMVAAVIDTAREEGAYVEAQASLRAVQDFVNPSPSRLDTLTKIEKDLAEKLKSWPGTQVSIRTQIDDLAKILVAGLVLEVDDGNDTHLEDKGDGIQRQILFRVFQLYADFRAQRGVFELAEGGVSAARGPSIIVFEEPELFLHPQAQEQFFDDLVDVAEGDQVLLSTHSSFLVRLEHAEGLHIVHRPTQTSATQLRIGDMSWVQANERQRLKEINLCSGDVSKVFFADRVVVTEGQEDVIYIVGTARDHARCLDRRVSVVEVGGKERIPSLQLVLNAFQIPYVVACDLDPGNPTSTATSEKIQGLVEEANKASAGMARLEHFDPDIPTVCSGEAPPSGEKPFNALQFIREGKPTSEFVERVRLLCVMQA